MEQLFTKDELFIINEFKNLKLNCIEINESFQSSIQSIIDIYLKSNSFLINFKNGFNRDHPLSEYSLNVLVQFEIGYNYWKNLQSINFESILNYCNKFNEIEKTLNSASTTISNNEKELLFSTINKQFNEKVEKFDNSIILIQLAIPQLFQFLSNLHSNSSEILLNKPIKYKNPIDGKFKPQQQQQNSGTSSLVSSFFTYFQKQDSTTQQQQQQQQLQLKNNKEKQSIQSKQLLESNENKSILSKLFSKVSITNTLLFLNPPTINQLLEDHSIHQKLWDSKIWIKNKIYTHSVKSELVQVFTFKEPCTLFWVKFWMSIPPTYQYQTVKYSSFTLHDAETDQLLLDSKVLDKNAFQPVWLIATENPNTNKFKVKYKIEADIYRCEVKSISEAEALELQLKNNNTTPPSSTRDTTIINFESISNEEKKIYKRPTSKINFDTPEFKAFILKNGLYRKQIPTTESTSSNITSLESVLSFTYRVSIFLKVNLKYISPPPGNTEALNTFQVGGGDCACLSHLACAIFRFNDIATRVLYGIILVEDETKECRHVKLEFYNEEVGLWFPYDPSDIAIVDPYYKTYFANDPEGNFVTHHLDPIFDIPILGTKEIRESVFQTSSFKYFYPIATPPQFDSITINFNVKREKN